MVDAVVSTISEQLISFVAEEIKQKVIEVTPLILQIFPMILFGFAFTKNIIILNFEI